jgi:hypothetical protein
MSDPLPARISVDGRTATWNPALTRAQRVVLAVATAQGVQHRAAMNSGRARVRDGEAIQSVSPQED